MSRRALRRIPRGALACALIACLNAACWSFVTPPFQVPDEPDHYAYVKQLFETGRLPSSNTELTSGEVVAVLLGLHYEQVREQPENHTISSQTEVRELQHDLQVSAKDADIGSPAAGVAASQPPLYYALEAIPYGLGKSGTVLDRLQLMRLLSALFAGLTAMFAFLFVREALPGASWAWIVGGLGVALAPLLGFMSGAVNPDAMLFAVSAAIFYCVARAFRRGFSMRAAAVLGTLTAVGFLTKLNFIGLAPGIFLGLLVLSIREARSSRRSAYLRLALAVAIALSPVVLYAIVNVLSGHRVLGIVSSTLRLTHGSILAQANYIWQLCLPRLPGTTNDFPGLFTLQQLWFRGYVGLYGWLDTPFPGWVSAIALIPAGALVLLCGRSLVQGRAVLRTRAAELAVYASVALGLMLLIGADSYLTFPLHTAEYAQVRYLLPLLPLLGAVLVLAARGAGRRWGPVLGTLIVVLFLAHDVFSQLLVVARYYG
jgi:4-amino-4-deoxy-L-arabinose transferase-like glycosyltransferase